MAQSTEDERYRQSTQFRLWSYSPSQLADLRAKTNSLAKQNISERLSSSVPVSTTVSANPSGANTPIAIASGGISTSTAPADVPLDLASTSAPDKPSSGASLPEFLTPAEEELLLRYYTVETLRAAEFCALPTSIRATAAIFLRRFFVTHSVMTYPPAKMLKTCVFFGCKTENYYPRVRSIAEKFPNTTGEEILAGEFLLCQGIRFAFDIRHPFGALEGAMMQLRTLVDLNEERFQRVYTRAREILKFSPIVTDAYFHYTPSQIMLAALLIADVELFDRIIDASFAEHLMAGNRANIAGNGVNGNSDGALSTVQAVKDKTVATIKECRDMLLQEPPERMTEFWGTAEANNLVKPLNKKLRKCRDPDRFDLIGLHKKRLEFREKEAGGAKTAAEDDGAVFGEALKSDADREPKRRRVAGEDPFGPPL